MEVFESQSPRAVSEARFNPVKGLLIVFTSVRVNAHFPKRGFGRNDSPCGDKVQ